MRDVIIIGSGPAGLTAAVYAARANLEPLVIEGAEPGGQLTLTTMVENYPGFPEGIMGPQLMEDMKKQAQRFGTEVLSGYVDRVEFGEKPFKVFIEKQEFRAKSVIISTGSSAKLLGLENEKRLMGHGVSTCATCDGFFFRGKKIAVVGGGDSAMEESTFLTKFATEVALIHRRRELRASKIMQDRALANEKIKVHYDTVVEDVLGDEAVTGIRLRGVNNGKTTEMELEGLFVAIGHNPNTGVFKGQIDLDEKGYIRTRPDSTATNVPGVFACGDVQDPIFRQAVTAAGTGCMSALEAEKYLAEHASAAEAAE
jgi:thioredoxin reductase (NADPH)